MSKISSVESLFPSSDLKEKKGYEGKEHKSEGGFEKVEALLAGLKSMAKDDDGLKRVLYDFAKGIVDDPAFKPAPPAPPKKDSVEDLLKALLS